MCPGSEGDVCRDLQITQLTSLQTLDLSNTCLSALPQGMTALAGLEELLLGACSFRAVPAHILRQLASLKTLDLSRNTDIELQALTMDDLIWLATGTPFSSSHICRAPLYPFLLAWLDERVGWRTFCLHACVN